MAEKCDEDLRSEIGRKVCLVKGNDGEYRGYKKEILIENLSERENMTFVCIRCEGIMREVCTSSVGEQFCSCCKKEGEQTYPNLRMDNMVLSFKCSCPLMGRGCGWLGTIRDCENHLDTCGCVYEACNLSCGEVLQRQKLRIHEKENCPQRIVKCEHCHKEFKSCELPTHLDKCPKMEVSCELCVKILCREDMTQHLEQYCVENEIECPFVKYKCEMTSIQRKYLNQHLEEKTTKHLELKLTAMEELILKQSDTIEKQTGIISEQSREMEQSSRRIATLEKESKQSISDTKMVRKEVIQELIGNNSECKKQNIQVRFVNEKKVKTSDKDEYVDVSRSETVRSPNILSPIPGQYKKLSKY